jgi:DNA-directed RNA polymerase subunit RPC12/RpoP
MTQFLYNFACFDCQVSFKRPATSNSATGSAYLAEAELIHNCPNCGHRMAFMGRNFAAPPKSGHSAWIAAKCLWEAGFRFSGSGYHSDPPLPRTKQEVVAFVKENSRHSQRIGRLSNWSEYA